jgi:hypothetical protein
MLGPLIHSPWNSRSLTQLERRKGGGKGGGGGDSGGGGGGDTGNSSPEGNSNNDNNDNNDVDVEINLEPDFGDSSGGGGGGGDDDVPVSESSSISPGLPAPTALGSTAKRTIKTYTGNYYIQTNVTGDAAWRRVIKQGRFKGRLEGGGNRSSIEGTQ